MKARAISTLVLAFASYACFAAGGAELEYSQFYVSTATGSDATGEGTQISPWASVGYTLSQLAPSAVNPATINVAVGVYREDVSLPAYVDLSGGYDPATWEHNVLDQETRVYQIITTYSPVIRHITMKREDTWGLVCGGQSQPKILGCRIDSNGGRDTGGVQILDQASPTFIDCELTLNWHGYPYPPPQPRLGGAVLHLSAGTSTFIRCLLANNRAQAGGAIYATQGSIICRDCAFSHNTAEVGASIYETGEAAVTLVNCRFTDNVLSGGFETHDLFMIGSGPKLFQNCTLANTVGTTEVAWIGGTIRNCILRGPVVMVGGDISYSNISGYRGAGVGNTDLDPMFVNAAEEDYRLLPNSPCIDTGTGESAPDHDLDGVPRPVDIPGKGFDGPGQGFDMGAYEFVPPQEDLNKDGKVDKLDLYLFQKQWHRGEEK